VASLRHICMTIRDVFCSWQRLIRGGSVLHQFETMLILVEAHGSNRVLGWGHGEWIPKGEDMLKSWKVR
jgi:hypothetical protein